MSRTYNVRMICYAKLVEV